MTRLWQRLKCYFGSHAPRPGVTPETRWCFSCRHCGQLLLGGRGAAR